MTNPNPDSGLNWWQKMLVPVLRPLIREAVTDAIGASFLAINNDVDRIASSIDTIPNNVAAAVNGVIRETAVDAGQLATTISNVLTGALNPTNLAREIADQLPSVLPHLFTRAPGTDSPRRGGVGGRGEQGERH